MCGVNFRWSNDMGKRLREGLEWAFMCFLFWLLSWWPADDNDDKGQK